MLSHHDFPKQYERLAGEARSANDGNPSGGARYLSEAHWICPRLTALSSSDLEFLDKVQWLSRNYKKISNKEHEKLKILIEGGTKLRSQTSTQDGRLFRLATWSRHLSYALLSFSQKQKNTSDNKAFTKDLLEQALKAEKILAQRVTRSASMVSLESVSSGSLGNCNDYSVARADSDPGE